MLGIDHESVSGLIDILKQKCLEVSAYVQWAKPLQEFVDLTLELEHTGRIYVAVAGATINLVVKPAMKVPVDNIKRAIRKVILGTARMKLWCFDQRGDGREVLTEDNFGWITCSWLDKQFNIRPYVISTWSLSISSLA